MNRSQNVTLLFYLSLHQSLVALANYFVSYYQAGLVYPCLSGPYRLCEDHAYCLKTHHTDPPLNPQTAQTQTTDPLLNEQTERQRITLTVCQFGLAVG